MSPLLWIFYPQRISRVFDDDDYDGDDGKNPVTLHPGNRRKSRFFI